MITAKVPEITDGSVVGGPAAEVVATYPVKVDGASIDIEA